MYCDTVFTLNKKDSIVPYMVFDTHGKRPTARDRADTDRFLKQAPGWFTLRDPFEISKYIIYRVTHEKIRYRFFYEKQSKELFKVNTDTYLKDDLAGGPGFEPKFCSDEKLFSWVDVLTLKKYVSSELFKNAGVKNSEKKRALKELADSLKDTDNPVLIVVTPKK
jgi:hypothetical protein